MDLKIHTHLNTHRHRHTVAKVPRPGQKKKGVNQTIKRLSTGDGDRYIVLVTITKSIQKRNVGLYVCSNNVITPIKRNLNILSPLELRHQRVCQRGY